MADKILDFYKTPEAEIPTSIVPGLEEVHFTETGKIFTYSVSGEKKLLSVTKLKDLLDVVGAFTTDDFIKFDGNTFVPCKIDMHEHSNLTTVLDKLSIDASGKLLFDSLPISGTVSEMTGTNVTLNQDTGMEANVQLELQKQRDVLGDLNLRSEVGEMLDYGYFTFNTNSLNTQIPLIRNNSNMLMENNGVRLKKDKTYSIDFNISSITYNNSAAQCIFQLKNSLNEVLLNTTSLPVTNTLNAFHNNSSSISYTPTKDMYIYPIISYNFNSQLSTYFGQLNVQEIGRTFVQDPMLSLAKYQVEHGSFMLNHSTTPYAINELFPMFKVGNSNLIKVDDYRVKLLAGKTYSFIVSSSLKPVGSGGCGVSIKDSLGNVILRNHPITTDTPAIVTGATSSNCIYTTLTDTVINISCDSALVGLSFLWVTIQEIAQPKVIEYTRNISNPLTTEPLEYGTMEIGKTETLTTDKQFIFSSSNGNLQCDGVKVYLKKGKTYNISSACRFSSTVEMMRDSYLMLNNFIVNCNSYSKTAVPQWGSLINIVTLYTPPEDGYLWIDYKGSSSNGTGNPTYYRFFVTVQEIRSNPVNQYGGFQSKVLFEGNASTVSSNGSINYTLTDDKSNYDFILIQTSVGALLYPMESKGGQMYISCIWSEQFNIKLDIRFGSNTSFYIINKVEVGFTASVLKVVGIKGSIPTLLSGGEF